MLALAVKYAEELRTHVSHVQETLEELWDYAYASGEYSVRLIMCDVCDFVDVMEK